MQFDLTQLYIPIIDRVSSSAGRFTQTRLKTKTAQNISHFHSGAKSPSEEAFRKRRTQTGEE